MVLIDTSGVQRLLDALAAAVDRQRADTLVLLERLGAAEAALHAATRDGRALHASITALEKRVGAIESSIEQSARAVDNRLNHIEERLPTLVDVHVLHATVDSVQAKTLRGVQSLESTAAATTDAVKRLENAHQMLEKHVRIAHERIDTKLDKMDMTQVEMAAAKVVHFEKQTKAIEASLDNVLDRMDAVEAQWEREMNEHRKELLERETSNGKSLTRALHAVRHDIDARLSAVSSGWKTQLQLLQEEMESKLHGEKQSISKQILATDGKVKELKSVLQASCRQLAAMIDKKAERKDTVQELERLEKMMQTKVQAKQMNESIESELQHLKNWFNQVQPQVDISIRFIEWFYSRGEAYEHNLQSIESQLQHLAKSSM